jgi:membrane associated rhomboid family serine protease
MSELASDPLEDILRQCAAAKPDPWYPREYAEKTGIPPASLDPYLDRLRLGGFIRLTDWVPGKGQGYVLTTEGLRVLGSSWALSRLRSGQLHAAREETAPAPAARRGLTTFDRGEIIRHALLAPATPAVTRLLFWANVMVFLIGLMWAQQQGVVNEYLSGMPGQGQGQAQQVMQMQRLHDVWHRLQALEGGDLARGEWWRLLTCCFVHFGFMHIAMNMLGLYIVGPLVERMWGHLRFLAIYLISGVVGSCAMSFTLAGPGLGAGASGALWGMMVSMAVWVFLNRHFLPRQLVSSWLRQLGGLLILNVFISFMPGVSAAAHFGGGFGGLVAGALLNYQRFGKSWLRWVALVGVLLLPVAGVVAVLPPAQAWYRQMLQRMPQVIGERQAAILTARDYENLRGILADAQKLSLRARGQYDDHIERVLDQKAAARTPAGIKEAEEALATARENVREAVGLLAQAGPYAAPELEAARQKRKEQLEELDKLFALREECLRRGKGLADKDEKDLLEQQVAQERQAGKQFSKAEKELDNLKERLREILRH